MSLKLAFSLAIIKAIDNLTLTLIAAINCFLKSMLEDIYSIYHVYIVRDLRETYMYY